MNKEKEKAMQEMECWHTDIHIKKCKNHNFIHKKELEKVFGEIEKKLKSNKVALESGDIELLREVSRENVAIMDYNQALQDIKENLL